jgi:hypothetical protein
MLAIGGPDHNIYTQADVIRMNDESVAHFLLVTGYDFSLTNPNIVYDPIEDTRTLLVGVLFGFLFSLELMASTTCFLIVPMIIGV